MNLLLWIKAEKNVYRIVFNIQSPEPPSAHNQPADNPLLPFCVTSHAAPLNPNIKLT